MNLIQRWDLTLCRVCLTHGYNQAQARICRRVSRTGDGHGYLLLGLLACWLDDEQGLSFLCTALGAFAIELPLYLLLKNLLCRERPRDCRCLFGRPIATACPPATRRRPS